MRKVFLLVAVLALAGVTAGLYPRWVEKPVKDGAGPLAVRISAQYPVPEFHSPLDWWQTHHMDVLNRGDMAANDCLYCHVPANSCNKCHGYVGVAAIADRTN